MREQQATPLQNIQLALSSAQSAFGVPPLIEPADVTHERLLILYLHAVWQRLNRLQASSVRTRQLVRLISFVLANDRLRDQYLSCANQLSDFVTRQSERLSAEIGISENQLQV